MSQAPNPHKDEIIRRRKAGERPTDIAKALGISKGAVIGICYRAGLCSFLGNRMAVVGEANGQAKLTEDQVRYIRASGGKTYAALAKELGVSPWTVASAFREDTWKHVA